MLKKVVILLLVLLSGLVAAKVLNLPIPFLNEAKEEVTSKMDVKKSDGSIVKFIPAQSAFYAASELALLHKTMEMSNAASYFEQAKESAKSEYAFGEQEELVFDSIFGLITSLFTTQSAMEYGFDTNGEMAFYMSGLFPVLKVSVADQSKIEMKLKELLSFSDELTLTDVELSTAKVKQINIEDEVNITYQITDQYFTVTFTPSILDNAALASVFDANGPTNSLVSSGVFAADQAKYGFNGQVSTVLNFEEIAKALVDPSANLMGQQIDQYIPDVAGQLEMLRTDECKADILSIANAMPRLIAGYSNLDYSDTTIDANSAVILEVKNPAVTNILKKIQGHISSNAFDPKALLSVGVGIDVAALLPAYEELTQLVQATQFTCMPLAMGKMMMPPAPAQLAMANQFAGSVKGISASIIDVDVEFSENGPKLNNLDAIVSVSTTDAQTLVDLANGASMGMVTFEPLDPNGAPSQLQSMFLPPELQLFAAIKNNFLTVYSGEQGEAAAQSLNSESLESNALLSAAFNLGKIWAKDELLKTSLMMSGGLDTICSDPATKDAISMMSANRGHEVIKFEFNDHGIVISDSGKYVKADSAVSICP